MLSTRWLWSALLCVLLIESVVGQSALPVRLVPLQGTWIVSAAERGGKPLDSLQGAKFTIGEDSFELQTATGEYRGKFRVRVGLSPKEMDLRLTSGTTWLAIFAVTDKLLRLNYVDAAASPERPKLFSTSAEAPGTLLVMRRD